MDQPRRRTANVRYFSERMRPRNKGSARSSPRQIVALRLNDFATLFRSRYGVMLPNDDAGRDDLEPVMHHLAALPHPARRAEFWIEVWAPWLTVKEQRQIIAQGIAGARAWSADQLAWRYRITKEERRMLGLTTIGAIDQGKAARTKQRRARDRQRKANDRRAKGLVPRQQYEANAASRTKPWEAEGISRATWYRRKRASPETDTGPSTA